MAVHCIVTRYQLVSVCVVQSQAVLPIQPVPFCFNNAYCASSANLIITLPIFVPWALVKILNDTNSKTNPEETAMSFVSSLLSSLPTLQFCYYLSSEAQPNFQITLYQRLHSSLDKKDIDSFVQKITYLRKSRLVNLGSFFIPCISFSCLVIFSFKNRS